MKQTDVKVPSLNISQPKYLLMNTDQSFIPYESLVTPGSTRKRRRHLKHFPALSPPSITWNGSLVLLLPPPTMLHPEGKRVCVCVGGLPIVNPGSSLTFNADLSPGSRGLRSSP